MLFRENDLQFKVVNNFHKKLHFKISYGMLNLPWVFFRFTIIDLFLFLTFSKLMERQFCTQMSVWQQRYHNNVCHVIWMFWLTLDRSLHFFLVLFLLTLYYFNLIFNLILLTLFFCECYLMTYLCRNPNMGYICGSSCKTFCIYFISSLFILGYKKMKIDIQYSNEKIKPY